MSLGSAENNVQLFNVPCDRKLGGYTNCISLGGNCRVASSMNRYGLRSHSGPFDWFTSDFKPVLKVIETHFSDFMAKKNLSVDTNNHEIFWDNKYGFCCRHDIQYDFESEYECIHQKYMRRAKQFMQDIEQPTFFIRYVLSEEEICFIEENREYIYSIIKKENPNNEIAFLIPNGMQKLSNYFLWFQLGISHGWGSYSMRREFDLSSVFSEYCMKHILSEESIVHNKEFDKSRIGMELLEYSVQECSSNIALALKEYYPNIDRGIYLWGAGIWGTRMVQYLIKNGITVNGIIDNATNKIGTLCEGVPIVPFSKIEDNGLNIFITIRSDTKATDIQKLILDIYPDTKILKLHHLGNILLENRMFPKGYYPYSHIEKKEENFHSDVLAGISL